MKQADLGKLLGMRIRELRERKGMTAEKLAWDSDLSKSYVSMIENGHRFPTLPTLLKFSQLLHVHIREFLDFPEPDKQKRL